MHFIKTSKLPAILLGALAMWVLPGTVSCREAEPATPVMQPATDGSLQWTDYCIGELPPPGYYDAMDSLVKKWGIRYRRIEAGCEGAEAERQCYENANAPYFRQLEQQFGKNWRRRFDAELITLDSMLKRQR